MPAPTVSTWIRQDLGGSVRGGSGISRSSVGSTRKPHSRHRGFRYLRLPGPGYAGLRIVNVSNPQAPPHHNLRHPSYTASVAVWNICLRDGRVVRFADLNVADPQAPCSPAATIRPVSLWAWRSRKLRLRGGLHLRPSSTYQPRAYTRWKLQHLNVAFGVAVAGSYATLRTEAGLQVINVQPASPLAGS